VSDSKRLQTDLVKIVDAGRLPDKRLGPRAEASAIPSTAGSAKPKKPPGSGAGTAGIASPLTEPDYTARTWHATRSITDTSGLFTIEYECVEEVVMEDANSAPNEVRLIFADEP
jgi:hypothetical protein